MKKGLLAKRAYINHLFDYYGVLLTSKQQTLIKWYYGEDLSLSEIANSLGVSRTAVSDALKQSVEKMMSFDQGLGLINQEKKLLTWIESLSISPVEKSKAILTLNQWLKKRGK